MNAQIKLWPMMAALLLAACASAPRANNAPLS